MVAQFHRELKMYYKEGTERSLPTVAYFAKKACLTPKYFSDLVRKETGMSPKDIISNHIISHANQLLIKDTDDVSQIAYSLGFEYPAHFSRMFKRIVGLTPSEFRLKSEFN